MNNVDAKQQALNDIVTLAKTHDIALDDIAAKLQTQKTPEQKKGVIGLLLNYLGGVFIFSGIGLLINFMWDDIGSAQRVIITFGPGLACFILGIFCVRDQKYIKAATPLFLLSALMQPTGIFVFLDEFLPPSDDAKLAAMLIFGTFAVQQGLAFWVLKRTSLLFFTLLFWNSFIATAMDLMDIDGELIGTIVGLSILALTWRIDKTPYRAITPFWYFIGAFLTLASWWSVVEGTFLDLSYVGMSALLIYASIYVSSRTLLFVSVIGLLAYMSYFAWEYFADAIGWPITLIFLGLAMMGTSAYAVKLGQRIGKRT